MSIEAVYRFFGISENLLRERLAELLTSTDITAALSFHEEDSVLRVTAQDEKTAQAVREMVLHSAGIYLYCEQDISLEQQTVALLKEKGKTVSVAESCTGGLLASRLTAVSGCSAVFGTGVVSYSWECKKKQLGVSDFTLKEYGAVSPQTAREMANGIRKRAGADIGIGITGEAGPTAAEAQPVGTVYVALADCKRTWVKVLHLDALIYDRNAIRRIAASYALDLLRRYLQAYPAVMAGGERHALLPKAYHKESKRRGFMAALHPWRGNSKRRLLKLSVWVMILAVLVGGMLSLYRNILAPDTNRELQDDLADLYWGSTSDLTEDVTQSDVYPSGMKAQFRSLYDINPDIAGWLRIADTTINYPLVSYADGYYANHSFNDQYSQYGQPYFDKINTLDTLSNDRVLTVHGNNTRDEQMFSPLLSYRRIAYLREHPVIEMDTLYTAARWEIFAVMVLDERERGSGFDYVLRDFEDNNDYLNYIAKLKRRSLFHSNIELTAQDRVLLLVTDAQQEYGFAGARLVVAARRITQEQASATYRVNTQVLMPAAIRKNTTTTVKSITTTSTTQTSVLSGVTQTVTVSTSAPTKDVQQSTTVSTVTKPSLVSSTTTKTTAASITTTSATTVFTAKERTTTTVATDANKTSSVTTAQPTRFVTVTRSTPSATTATREAEADVKTNTTTTYVQLSPDDSELSDVVRDMEMDNHDHIGN